MPELPEVETVRLGLQPVLEGHVLSDVVTRRGDLRVPFPRDFAARMRGFSADPVEDRWHTRRTPATGGIF